MERDKIYTLKDQQGGSFGEGYILYGDKEVFKQFQSWAEADNTLEDTTLKGWTFGDLTSLWLIDIMILDWDTLSFRELTDTELGTANKVK